MASSARAPLSLTHRDPNCRCGTSALIRVQHNLPRELGGPDDGAVVLARDFELDSPIASARLYITAHGIYDAWIGCRRVGDHQLDPRWTI